VTFPTDQMEINAERFKYKSSISLSTWDMLKKYINHKTKIGETFKRRYLLKYIMGEAYNNKGKQMTVDIYRCHLTTIGILKRIGQGKYMKIRDIPEGLSSSKLKEIAQDSSWKSWFIPQEERLKMIEDKYR
jgi:hypothetical protein